MAFNRYLRDMHKFVAYTGHSSSSRFKSHQKYSIRFHNGAVISKVTVSSLMDMPRWKVNKRVSVRYKTGMYYSFYGKDEFNKWESNYWMNRMF